MDDCPFRAPGAIPQIAQGHRLQWEPAQDCYVILYPEGMVKLNGTASKILKLCTGKMSVAELIRELNAQFPDADVADDVSRFLQVAHENGWICAKPSP
ncbi:MAG: pyrroloquinoline quinone biosynthesis peptide chaperone PqqD [Gammaproteobacteria bacterium]